MQAKAAAASGVDPQVLKELHQINDMRNSLLTPVDDDDELEEDQDEDDDQGDRNEDDD